jgi:hypothetical protein
VRVFHRTSTEAARRILTDGFQDGEGTYLTRQVWRGVWVSDTPLTVNEGAVGDVVLAVDIPLPLFDEHEWVEEGKGYREALVPAAELNRYRVLALDEDDE